MNVALSKYGQTSRAATIQVRRGNRAQQDPQPLRLLGEHRVLRLRRSSVSGLQLCLRPAGDDQAQLVLRAGPVADGTRDAELRRPRRSGARQRRQHLQRHVDSQTTSRLARASACRGRPGRHRPVGAARLLRADVRRGQRLAVRARASRASATSSPTTSALATERSPKSIACRAPAATASTRTSSRSASTSSTRLGNSSSRPSGNSPATGVIYRNNINFINSVLPDARWTPTARTNPLTNQPITVYRWNNRTVGEKYLIRTTTDSQYLAPDGSVVGTASPYRKYYGMILVLQKAISPPLGRAGSHVWSRTKGTVNNTAPRTSRGRSSRRRTSRWSTRTGSPPTTGRMSSRPT